MAAMNSSVCQYNYTVSGTGISELVNAKTTSMPSVVSAAQTKVVAISAQQLSTQNNQAAAGRRAALLSLAAIAFTTVSSNSAANAGVINDYLEKSKANKELNDKKRLTTSVQTLQEHSLFNFDHASSLRTSLAAKIPPSKMTHPDPNIN